MFSYIFIDSFNIKYEEYDFVKIYHSANNWTIPLNYTDYAFELYYGKNSKYKNLIFYIIETDNPIISFKIKIKDEYILLPYQNDKKNYLTINDNGFINNQIITTDDNCLFNGFLKIKSFENKIKIFTDNYILFEGNTLNGNLDGHGIIYYENDNKSFEGEFLKGQFNGKAISYYENGNKSFEGEFKNDSYNGQGIKYYANGNKSFEGYFKNDSYNGQGIEYYLNGNKEYEGYFEDDEYHGKGIEYYLNGNKKYEGDFSENKYNGKGIEYYENGNKKYEGNFSKGKYNEKTFKILS